MAGDSASLTFRLFGVDVNASSTIHGVGAAALGTGTAIETLGIQVTKYSALAVAAGVATAGLGVAAVGVAGSLGVVLAGGFLAAGAAAALSSKQMQQEFKTAITTIRTEIEGVSAPVRTAISGVINNIVTTVGTLRPQIAGIFAQIAPMYTELGNGLVDAIHVAVDRIPALLDTIKPIFQVFTQSLGAMMTSVMVTLQNILTPLSQNIGAWQQFINMINMLLPALGAVVGQLVLLGVQALPLLAPLLFGILGVLNQAIVLFGQLGVTVLPVVGRALLVVADALGNGLAVVLPVLARAVITLLPPLANLAAALINAAAPILVQLLPAVAQLVAAFAGALAKALPAITPLLAALSGMFVAVLKALMPVIPSVVALAVSLGTSLGTVLKAITPLFGPLAQIIGAVAEALAAILPPVARLVAAFITALMPAVRALTPVLAMVASILGQAIAQAIVVLTPAITSIAQAFSRLIVAIAPILPLVAQLVAQIVVLAAQLLARTAPAFVALINAAIPLAPLLVRLLQAFLPIIDTVLRLAVAIAGPMISAFASMLSALAPVINFLGVVFVGYLNVVITVLGVLLRFWQQVFQTMAQVFATAWNTIYSIGTVLWNALSGFFIASWNGLVAFWAGTWNTIRTVAITVWSAIAGFFAGAFNAFSGAWSAFWNGISFFFSATWNAIRNAAITIWNAIVGFFSGAWAAFQNAFKGFLDTIGRFFADAWHAIQNAAVTIWNAIAGFFAGAFDGFKRAFKDFVDTVGRWWADAWHAIDTAIRTIWGGIWGFITGAWDNFKRSFKDFVDTIGRWWADAWHAMAHAIDTIWSTIVGFFKTPINIVLDVVGGFSHVVDNITDAIGLGKPLGKFEKIPHLRDGARLGGYGGGDIVPAMLEPGEAVVPKHLVRDRGFQDWASHHGIPGFMAGGVVGEPGVTGWRGGTLYAAGGILGTGIGPDIGPSVLPSVSSVLGGALSGLEGVLNLGDEVIKAITGFDVGKWVANKAAHLLRIGAADAVTGLLNTMMKPVDGALSSKGIPGSIAGKEAHNIIQGIHDFIAGKEEKPVGGGSPTGAVTKSVTAWAPTILQALSMLGMPASLLGAVECQMQTESGGNPNAINLTDSNAQKGTPSKGLMQVIDPTFASYHVAGTSGNIYDPLANIAAALNYARARYGDISSVFCHGHGYAEGGLVSRLGPAIRGFAKGGACCGSCASGGDCQGFAAGGLVGQSAATDMKELEKLGLLETDPAGSLAYRMIWPGDVHERGGQYYLNGIPYQGPILDPLTGWGFTDNAGSPLSSYTSSQMQQLTMAATNWGVFTSTVPKLKGSTGDLTKFFRSHATPQDVQRRNAEVFYSTIAGLPDNPQTWWNLIRFFERQEYVAATQKWNLSHGRPANTGLKDGGLVQATYDSGGWLQPGWTMAYNGTGRPERVVGPGDDGQGNHYHFHMNGVVGDKEAVMRWVRDGLREHWRRNGQSKMAQNI